ncbi:hypothetical protein [Arthrobacter silvisoli]|nr:hypothetical protein [Arthrobacter silvisoli]
MLVAAGVPAAGFVPWLFVAEETNGMSLAQAGGETAKDTEPVRETV